MIDLQHVTKTYTKNNKKAVDDLTLQVKGGELFGHDGVQNCESENCRELR